MRLFCLDRDEDMTGVSGVGIIAIGATSITGETILVWLTEHSSIGFYRSLDDLKKIHCHHDATQVRWLDEQPNIIKEVFDGSYWEAYFTDLYRTTRTSVFECLYGEATIQRNNSRDIIADRQFQAELEREQQARCEQGKCNCTCAQATDTYKNDLARLSEESFHIHCEVVGFLSKIFAEACKQLDLPLPDKSNVGEAVAQRPDTEAGHHSESAVSGPDRRAAGDPRGRRLTRKTV